MDTIIEDLISYFGNPIVTTILIAVGLSGYWILRNRIEVIKDRNDLLETELEILRNYAPDILVQRYAAGYKVVNEELERMNSELTIDKNQIRALEKDRDNMANQLLKAAEACGENCRFCYFPNKDGINVEFPIEYNGKIYEVNVEAICQNCGRKTVGISDI